MKQAQVEFLEATKNENAPECPVERELWAMGFGEVERRQIMAVARMPECKLGAVEIGRYIMAGEEVPFFNPAPWMGWH